MRNDAPKVWRLNCTTGGWGEVLLLLSTTVVCRLLAGPEEGSASPIAGTVGSICETTQMSQGGRALFICSLKSWMTHNFPFNRSDRILWDDGFAPA